jgi:hypothetical protein
MKKLISYIAIDKEEVALVYYIPSKRSKSCYPEDEYYIYEVTSLKQLYKLLSGLGYDDEYIENFMEYRLTHSEHATLWKQDYMED